MPGAADEIRYANSQRNQAVIREMQENTLTQDFF